MNQIIKREIIYQSKIYLVQQIFKMDENSKQKQPSHLMILKNLPRQNRKQPKIKVDISRTEYGIIKKVVNDRGWKIWHRQELKDEINLIWADTYLTDEFIKRLKPYQKVNHFPGSQQLGFKNKLYRNLNHMRQLLPEDYNFYPTSWNLPEQMDNFHEYCKEHREEYFIVKPNACSQGRGIYLTQKLQCIAKFEQVVQVYLEKPLLIQNSKFDFRIYVLLKSISPLSIFVFGEGLTRFAIDPYQAPNKDNFQNHRMHLTNYAINKLSPLYIYNHDANQDDIGHKRSLTAVMQTLKKRGCNVQNLQNQIDQIIVKTILSAYPKMQCMYKQCRNTKEEVQSVCFEVLGFDIMIDENYKPVLIQVNHSPSFLTETPLDKIVKKFLIIDTLELLNFNPLEKINYLKKKLSGNFENDSLYINEIKLKYQSEPKEINMGGYRKIYPLNEGKTADNQCDGYMTKNSQKIYAKIVQVQQNQNQRSVRKYRKQPLNQFTKPLSNEQPYEKKNDNEVLSKSFYRIVNNIKRYDNKKVSDILDDCKAQSDEKTQSELSNRFRMKNKLKNTLAVSYIGVKFGDGNRNFKVMHDMMQTNSFCCSKGDKSKQVNKNLYKSIDLCMRQEDSSNCTSTGREKLYESDLRNIVGRMQFARIKLQKIKKIGREQHFDINQKISMHEILKSTKFTTRETSVDII